MATPKRTASCTTGRTRRSSSSTGTAGAPGRVDSPPMSRMLAPWYTSDSACRNALKVSACCPPSENESGVTFTMPMMWARCKSSRKRPACQKSCGVCVMVCLVIQSAFQSNPYQLRPAPNKTPQPGDRMWRLLLADQAEVPINPLKELPSPPAGLAACRCCHRAAAVAASSRWAVAVRAPP